jgi:hypothetical protein
MSLNLPAFAQHLQQLPSLCQLDQEAVLLQCMSLILLRLAVS